MRNEYGDLRACGGAEGGISGVEGASERAREELGGGDIGGGDNLRPRKGILRSARDGGEESSRGMGARARGPRSGYGGENGFC